MTRAAAPRALVALDQPRRVAPLRVRVLILSALVAVAAGGCAPEAADGDGDLVPASGWPTRSWPSATPEAQGFDSVLLAEVVRTAAAGGLHSLFVARNGFVILDAYVYPYDATLYHDLRSVTKSVLTTLVGIAVDRGELRLDTPVVSLFPDRTIADREEKAGITVRHLVTMTSGLDCSNVPGEEALARMEAGTDPVGFALDLPLVAPPGARWAYCSPGMHLLAAVLQQATGMSAADYARANLFGPLGIADFYWPSDPQGVTHGWGDLALHPRDAAKIGLLLLARGEWEGERIVSSAWVTDATTGHTGTNLHEDYGFGWYVSPASEEVGYVRADGSGGQRILLVPELDLVVVTTGSNLDAGRLLGAVFDAITDQGRPLAANPSGISALEGLLDDLASGPASQSPPESPPIAAEVSGRAYRFEANPLGLESIALEFGDPSQATLVTAIVGEASSRIDRVGLDGRFHPSVGGRPIVARGVWVSDDTLVIEIDEGPGVHQYELRLEFTGPGLTLTVDGAALTGASGS